MDVSELRALVEAHPFRERIRAGPDVGACTETAGRRRRSRSRVGRAHCWPTSSASIPGPRLVELETAILAQDPELIPARGRRTRAAKATEAAPVGPSRRIVTVLVATLVPERTDGGAIDPEATSSITERAAVTVMQILERHGATVTQHGRELEGVFGHPQAHEDDAMRAVRAAHEIAEALASDRHAGSGDGASRSSRGWGSTPQRSSSRRRCTRHRCDTAGPHDRCSRRAVAPRSSMPKPTRSSATRSTVEPTGEGGAVILRSVDRRPGALGVARRIDSPMVGRALGARRARASLRARRERARVPAGHRVRRGRHREDAARRRIRAAGGRLVARPGRAVPLLRRRHHVLADRRGRAGRRRDPRWRRRLGGASETPRALAGDRGPGAHRRRLVADPRGRRRAAHGG